MDATPTNQETTMTSFLGIQNLDTAHGTVYRCEDCGSTLVPSAFANGDKIRHSRRCSTQAQPYAKAPVRFAPRSPSVEKFSSSEVRHAASE